MMVAIGIIESISPMKTITLLTSLAAFAFSGLCNASVDLGTPASGTPYDGYMSPVKQVLGQTAAQKPDISMDRVNQLMREGRKFRYSFTNPYTPSMPRETAARHSGDCKDKALWLANQLNDPSVRFVIGKARSTSKMSHAWLLWQHDGKYYILDCTNNYAPILADRVGRSEYIPAYSFARNGTYRHGSSGLVASVATAHAVASR